MIELKNVYASYGKLDVLKGVNLKAEKGQIVTIIGPNGAGKSTVFKSIFGLLEDVRGEIFFKGQNIVKLLPSDVLKLGISYVFQRRSVFPDMTIEENLKMGAYLRNDSIKIGQDIENLFVRFPILREKRKNKAKTLSGGQQRILEIARGLLLSPKLIMLDEPTIGLAPKAAENLIDEILKINRKGTTIIIVEQNAKKALELGDYTYVLVNGSNYIEGPSEEMRKDPRVIKSFLGGD